MTATINANYMATTNAAGAFTTTTTGWVQGTFIPDPAIRNWLAGGILATTETLPMWGGVGISETFNPNPTYTNAAGIVTTNPEDSLGGLITRATQIATGAGSLTGISVWDQAYGMVISAGNAVPLAGSGMQVNFFRLGSNARICVACAPGLSAIETDPVNQPVSWDFVNQQLIPYIAAYASASVQSATYTSSTGILSLTFASAPFGASIGATADGVVITLSGLTVSAGAASNVNGSFAITSTGTSGTVINVQAVAGLGTITINGGTGTLAAGGGALPCKVQSVLVGNSMTVNYNSTTGGTSWNYSGTVAVIQI